MDRLRLTAHETVYRVFDPRRNVASQPSTTSEPGALATRGTPPSSSYALLRHLSESTTQNAAWVEEFRSRFTAAAQVTHANLAATWEVLDIHGRPAVLQEWLAGLPSSDWPSLASVPSVWFRLLRQAAQGLHAAHSTGLVHGHLQANRVLLTADGVIKIAGFGEPDWLVPSQKSEVRGQKSEVRDQRSEVSAPSFNPEPTATALHKSEVASEKSEANKGDGDQGPLTSDLCSLTSVDVADLCRIAAAWAAPSPKKKGGKAKPFPKPLRAVLDRLKAEDADARYPSAAALLEDLDQAADHVPDNAEAWEKLVSHIRDQDKDDMPLKQSA
jgi:serine/threonine protein kinase